MQQRLIKHEDKITWADETGEQIWQAVSLQTVLLRASSAYRDPEHVSIWESWPDG